MIQNRYQLCEAMGEISQRCFAAGWLEDLEVSLWLFAIGVMPHGRWGDGIVSDADCLRLLRLAIVAGGWFRWSTRAKRPVFVPMAQWRRMETER